MNKEVVISPIFYMGNKKKLIKKGLIDLFPKDIDIFYDLFGGSGIVSMNTKAKGYRLNDLDVNLFNLYNLFIQHDSNFIINSILNNIEKYGLAKERTKRNLYKDTKKIEEYKKAYFNIRKDFNNTKDVLLFYTLMFYSFSQQFRFNSKGEFNMPCGNDCFSEKNQKYIKKSEYFFKSKNLNIYNKSYLDFNNFNKNDFVYLDPPYLNTTATYNESNGWDIQKEKELYLFTEGLDKKGIKFGMSNIQSQGLYDFCIKNNFNVHHFENFNYQACGKSNKVDEIYISNYKIKELKQLELF